MAGLYRYSGLFLHGIVTITFISLCSGFEIELSYDSGETALTTRLASNASLYSDAVTLSWSPRVTLFPNFLSLSECDFLKERALSDPMFDHSEEFNSIYVTARESIEHPIISDIERRIAVVTQSPSHPDEEAMCIHRILESSLTSRNINELHHDKANKEFTSVTVLIYLDEVEGGGETIWPCNSHDSSGVSFRQTCETVFNEGVRWHNGQRTVTTQAQHWVGQEGSSDSSTHGIEEQLAAMLQRGSDMCASREEAGASASGPREDWRGGGVQGGLRVVPRKGSAVLFHHDQLNGKGDPWAWHTGCEVRAGTKWTLQKFKETPLEYRTTRRGVATTKKKRRRKRSLE